MVWLRGPETTIMQNYRLLEFDQSVCILCRLVIRERLHIDWANLKNVKPLSDITCIEL